VTVDVVANWDAVAPNPSPPGHHLLAYFVLNANDIEFGSAGTTNLTVLIDGVNAGFASFARGTTSNGGRTLTIPFTDFQLGTSERFGFGLIGDQQGNMGAVIRIMEDGIELARAELTPRPVLPGTMAWDLVLSQQQWTSGVIQDQTVSLPMNLTIDRTSPIPVGDIVFNVFFDDVNTESTRVPAATRYRYQHGGLNGVFHGFAGTGGDAFVIPSVGAMGYITQIPGGWQVRLPAEHLNPFADLPRGEHGGAIDPNMRIHFNQQLRLPGMCIAHIGVTYQRLIAESLPTNAG